jgi:hypothetical protein
MPPEREALVDVFARTLKGGEYSRYARASALIYEMIYQQPMRHELHFFTMPLDQLLHGYLLRCGGIATAFDIRKCDYHSSFGGTDNVLQCLLSIDGISETGQEGGPTVRVG